MPRVESEMESMQRQIDNLNARMEGLTTRVDALEVICTSCGATSQAEPASGCYVSGNPPSTPEDTVDERRVSDPEGFAAECDAATDE